MSAPVFSGLTVLTPSVPRFQVAKVAFDLSGSYTDYFGYGAGAQIYADALVTGPNGETYRQPCRRYQDYVVTGHASGHGEEKATVGSPHWRLNFAPTYEGTWHATITAANASGATTSSSFSWTCTAATSSLSALRLRNGYLTYSDGTPMIPIGHNYAFNDRNYTLDLSAGADDFMDRMGAAEATLSRIWLHPHYRTEVDTWSATAAMYGGFDNDYSGVRGDINLRAAWDLEYLLDRAGQNDVSCILVLQAHGAFSTVSDSLWSENPYNAANGGPLSDPSEFFSSAMQFYWLRKMRFVQACAGAYPALGMYEYGNEMGSIGSSATTSYNSPTTLANWNTWISTVGPFGRSLDPWLHMRTASQDWEPQSWGLAAGSHFDRIWLNPNVEVGQFHRYHDSDETTNGDRGTSRQIALDFLRRIGKPVLQGESGLYRPGGSAPEPNFDPTTSSLTDVQISHLLEGTEAHNNQWESLMTPGYRWGGYWWWGSYMRDNSSQNRSSGTRHSIGWSFPLDGLIYPALAAFASAETPAGLGAEPGDTFVELTWGGGEDLSLYSPKPTDVLITTPSSMVGYGQGNNNRGWFWVRDELNRYDSGELPGDMAGRTVLGTIMLHGLADGTYAIDVWSTRGAGGYISTIPATSTGGLLSFTSPTIDRDVAFKYHTTTSVLPTPPPPPPAPPPIPPPPGPPVPPPRPGIEGSPEPSVVVIAYDGVDITSSVTFADASFESQIQAVPGAFSITLKDPDQTLGPFVTGREVTVDLDGIRIYGGYVLQVFQQNFVPVADTVTDGPGAVTTRQWVLVGLDYNFLMDKLVLRDLNRPLQQIADVVPGTFDGAIIRSFFGQVFDIPSGFDLVSQVQDIHLFSKSWAWQTQGSTMRDQLADLSQWGAFFFFDAYKQLHFEPVQTLVPPWGFSDIPNGTTEIGFREGSTTEDATGQVDESFVWGGNSFSNGSGGIVFGHASDPTVITQHGRWQLAENHVGDGNYASTDEVQARANIIVSGTEEGSTLDGSKGLVLPEKQYQVAWFSHDVPKDISGNRIHLQPGAITSLTLWSFSQDGGATPFFLRLPLKSVKITFPTLQDGTGRPYVRFDGFFGIQQNDPYWLWDYLLRQSRQRVTGSLAPSVVTSSSSTLTRPPTGSYFTGQPLETPDGVRTAFSFPFPYISGTTSIYINGLIQRPTIDYTESDPAGGQITFTSAPAGADALLFQCRTA